MRNVFIGRWQCLAGPGLLVGVCLGLACSLTRATTPAPPPRTPTPGPVGARPADFSIVYEWREGSLPPPYHYEYTITLPASGVASIEMQPGYPGGDVPVWTEPFTVSAADFDGFYLVVTQAALFTEPWRALADPPVGGSSENLTATANGLTVELPAFVIDRQAAQAQTIYAAVNALVPRLIWNKLEEQRQAYMAQAEP